MESIVTSRLSRVLRSRETFDPVSIILFVIKENYNLYDITKNNEYEIAYSVSVSLPRLASTLVCL